MFVTSYQARVPTKRLQLRAFEHPLYSYSALVSQYPYYSPNLQLPTLPRVSTNPPLPFLSHHLPFPLRLPQPTPLPLLILLRPPRNLHLQPLNRLLRTQSRHEHRYQMPHILQHHTFDSSLLRASTSPNPNTRGLHFLSPPIRWR